MRWFRNVAANPNADVALLAGALARALEKSFSSVSWPILACSALTSTAGCAGSAAASKTVAARSSSCRRQSVTWLGCTSCLCAMSAIVLSSPKAAIATLALNAGEWFRRGRLLIFCAPQNTGSVLAHRSSSSTCRRVQFCATTSLRPVHVHHHALARLHVCPRGLDRVVRTAPGSEPVTVFAEGGIDQGLQHLQQCLLDQPIQHRWDAQLALAPVRFGNHHLAYQLGPVRACQQRLARLRPTRAQ